MKQDVSEPVKDVTVDREEFGAAISKMLQTPKTSKPAISRKIKLGGRPPNFRPRRLPDSR
jgi:hypothetical protein